MKNEFVSHFSNIKNAGSNEKGTLRWFAQRLTGLMLILLPVKYMAIIPLAFITEEGIGHIKTGGIFQCSHFDNIIIYTMIGLAIYHGNIGIRIISEDYISCGILRNSLIIISLVFTILTIMLLFVVLIKNIPATSMFI